VGFLFLSYSGLVGTLAMLKPYLVDLGYEMKAIGLMFGIVGTSVGALSSFAAGFIVRRIGRQASRVLFAAVIFITAVFFYVHYLVKPDNLCAICRDSSDWGSYGMATIVVYTDGDGLCSSGT
jgi:MFS-type transporter involved in bile tolerance (Atg22 family)